MVKVHFLFCVYILGLFTVGCSSSKSLTTDEEKSTGPRGVILLQPDDIQRLGIVCSPIAREDVADTKSAVGWLEVPPTAQHIVRAPVTGFVAAMDDHPSPELGQTVAAGEKIARVNVFLTPQEVSQLVVAKEDTDTQMQQALVTMELSEAQLQQVLSARDAVTGVRIDQLKESLAHAKAAFKEAAEKMPYLIREGSTDGLLVKPIDIEIAISGRMLQVHATLGQFVVTGDPLWTVKDWTTLWLRVPLFEADANRIDHSTPATICDRRSGLVRTVPPILFPTESKPSTRTIDYYYKINNDDWRLRVGQSMVVNLPIGTSREAIIVPRSAVLFNAFEQPSCFVTNADATSFVERRIELGIRNGDRIEVTRGLSDGDHVVSIGAQQLAAEKSKADLLVEDND